MSSVAVIPRAWAGSLTRRICVYLVPLALALRALAQPFPPQIVVQPQDQYACLDSNVSFSVTVTGTPPILFYWFSNSFMIFDGVQSSNTNSILTITNVPQSASGAVFQVYVTSPYGGMMSSNAYLYVPDPAICVQPTPQSAPPGSIVLFSVIANGSPTLFYKWQRQGISLPNNGHFSGADTPNLTISNAQPADSGFYRVIVTNHLGSITSAAVRCDIGFAPVILVQPQNQSACLSSNVSFSVTATGSPPIQFSWFSNGFMIFNGVQSTATNSILTITNVGLSASGAVFQVYATSPVGQTLSSNAYLYVPDPAICVQPTAQSAPPGSIVLFSVIANGSPTLFYKWRRQGIPLSNNTHFSGTDTPTLTISNAQPPDSGLYSVVVTNHIGSITSAAVRCDIGFGPVIVTNLNSWVAPFQSTVQYVVGVTGTPPFFYRWFQNDVLIPGEANPVLTRTNVQRPEVGVYHVLVTNAVGAVTSTKAHLQVLLTTEGIPLPMEEATDDFSDLTNAMRLFVTAPPTVEFHGVPLLFTTYSSSKASWESNHCGVAASHTMWVLYNSRRAQWTRVSTEGSTFNTVVAVYTWNSTNGLQLIECNNDGGYDNLSSMFYFSALARQDYYIAIDGIGGATGIVRLEVGEILRYPRYNATNGTFRLEMAGPYWYPNFLQSSTDLALPRSLWPTNLFIPATNKDWVRWYTNFNAATDRQRFYTVGVRTNLAQ